MCYLCLHMNEVAKHFIYKMQACSSAETRVSTNQSSCRGSYLSAETIALDKTEDGCPFVLMALYCAIITYFLVQVTDNLCILRLVPSSPLPPVSHPRLDLHPHSS